MSDYFSAWFIGVTIALAVLEWVISYFIAFQTGGAGRGLRSDVLAAMIMLVIGGLFKLAGAYSALPCELYAKVVEEKQRLINVAECIAPGKEMENFGDMFMSTLGMNAVVAAVVLFIIFDKIIPWLFWRYWSAKAR